MIKWGSSRREANTGASPGYLTQEHHMEQGKACSGRGGGSVRGGERSSSKGTGHERKHSQLSSAPQTLLSPKSRTALILATGQTFGALQQSAEGYYVRTKEDAINNIYSQYTISFIIYPSQVCGRRQWHSTPVLLPGKSHGRRSLVGCHLWGRTESDTAEAT